ncbi:hypothetical protein ACHAQA_008016 [Verticillium albo-atrum]
MAESNTPVAETGAISGAKVSYQTIRRDCAILDAAAGSIIFDTFGNKDMCAVQFVAVRSASTIESYVGFALNFPMSTGSASGFGVRYNYDYGLRQSVQSTSHMLEVKFPRSCTYTVEDACSELTARFPGAKLPKGMCLVTVRLGIHDNLTVDGFGFPFVNPHNPTVEAWLNQSAPIVDDITLPGFLKRKEFCFAVATSVDEARRMLDVDKLPPPFAFPYGTEHKWKRERYDEQLAATKSKTSWMPSYSFSDDNNHLAVMTQSVLQDVIWLDNAAIQIRATEVPVYFVPHDSSIPPADEIKFFVIVPLTKLFRDSYDAAWRRFAKNETVELLLFADPDDTKPARWNCDIVAIPKGIELLNDHPTDAYEVVLETRRPKGNDNRGGDFEVKTFATRVKANEAREQGDEH